jgi:GT2 family glycosyltransferase
MLFDLRSFVISVIIPTLERGQQLERLLNLLALQKALGIEVVIVDDSLTRSTIEFEKFNFEVKYFFRGKKLGVSSARNIGASEAKGEYLIFLDDDDGFSNDWLIDFVNSSNEDPDLVFCDMKRIELNKKERIEKASVDESFNLLRTIFIPGAWMVRKELFERIGGYDEMLLYAENTELFIRLRQNKLNVSIISKANFIYYPSSDGGSKNLKNMVDSLLLILYKHDALLSDHVKRLYHQIIGVNYMRFGEFRQSRIHLLKAYLYNISRFGTLARYLISWVPAIARILYTQNPKL